MIDYKSIVNNLKDNDVFNLLSKMGAEPIDKEDYILCRTICHHTNEEECNYKLYYYKNTHLFYCYSSCLSMSIFKFLKTYYETRDIDYDWYDDIYNVVINCSTYQPNEGFIKPKYESLKDRYRPRKGDNVLPTYSNGILDMFVKLYPVEWLNDRITKTTMDKYNIRFSISQNKIIIPHYNVNGQLVGIRGRALNPDEIEQIGKYMPVQIEQKWYAHPLSLNLYGLNYNKENIRNYGVCYIGEAEKFCMQMESFNFPNCSVAVCGSQLNKYQIDLLMRICHPREIVICFDKEEKSGETKYFDKLYNICKKYRNYCNMSFIYDRNNLLNLKDSPTDRGQKVFEELVQTRVMVR